MLSENYVVACLLKITGRSYGAKYLGSCLMLQTGHPFGAKETVVYFLNSQQDNVWKKSV